jgi:hypothetical protein
MVAEITGGELGAKFAVFTFLGLRRPAFAGYEIPSGFLVYELIDAQVPMLRAEIILLEG